MTTIPVFSASRISAKLEAAVGKAMAAMAEREVEAARKRGWIQPKLTPQKVAQERGRMAGRRRQQSQMEAGMTPAEHVRRWHAHPVLAAVGDTVGAHQRRVAALCRLMAEAVGLSLEGSELIHAALHHDAAEDVVGDLPHTACQRWPDLARAYAAAQAEVLRERGLGPWRLSDEEALILRIADRADAWATAVRHGLADEPEWRAAREDLLAMAWRHGAELYAWMRQWIEGQEGHECSTR